MILHESLILALFVAAAIALFVANLATPRVYLFLAGFLLPMHAINQIVGGVNVMWHAFLGPISLGLLIFAPFRNLQALGERRFATLLGYAVAVTGVWMVLEYAFLHRYVLAQSLGLGPAQTVYKMPVQLVSLVFQLSAFYIIPTRADCPGAVYSAWNGLVAGCLFSAAAGAVMLATTGTGYVAPPGYGVFTLDGESLGRVGGLSGEPKNLGAFLVVVLLLVGGRYTYTRSGAMSVRLEALFVGLLVALFVTYSTSAWVGFMAGQLALFAMLATRRQRARTRLFAGFLTATVLLGLQSSFVRSVIEERVEHRLLDEEKAEVEGQKDNFVWDIYRDKPQHIVWGFGFGGTDLEATPYLLNEVRYRAQLSYIRTPTPATNGMRLLGDLGLAGLALLAAAALEWSRRLAACREWGLALFVPAALVAIMFVSINALATFMFVCGGAIALERMARARATAPSAPAGTSTSPSDPLDTPPPSPVTAR